MGQRVIRSWISRHSYHSAGQNVKNKKLDHRVKVTQARLRQLESQPQALVSRPKVEVSFLALPLF
jgi:hypothetical protein